MRFALIVLITFIVLSPGFADTAQVTQPAEQTDRPAGVSQQPEQQSEQPPPQLMSNEEVSELASRAVQPGEEVTGGALNNQQITYILIALATAVIVLVLK